ncbi:putative NADP-dependent mannitol dehydrogenase [Cytospora mali]|uniref:NADP-dependent mannitol dehydrogenase n=1 Tax=Cytospora mali TaxID=578113 RepID=A0A194UUY0_CYTMA|nr:putative NADP-dependent mannitol dehydrogenase [Valsa mali var. pyri (nom. inval.)]
MSMSIEEVAASSREPKPVPNIPSNVLEQFNMKGRVVAVTGASDGIGYAVTEAMAEAGAHIALLYNSNDAAISKGEALASKFGIQAKAYKVDVSDPEAVRTIIAAVVGDFGKLDVFVANAGMAISKPITEQTVEEYKKQYSVNVDGVFYCAKYAGEVFKKQGFGNLIITSSISALIVNVPVDQPVYNSTKAAVLQLGKSLAREWREFARVNIVCPGFFDTKMGASPKVINEGLRMTPLGRQGDVKEIKALYLYLASDASTYMTGSEIVIDGGYTLP